MGFVHRNDVASGIQSAKYQERRLGLDPVSLFSDRSVIRKATVTGWLESTDSADVAERNEDSAEAKIESHPCRTLRVDRAVRERSRTAASP